MPSLIITHLVAVVKSSNTITNGVYTFTELSYNNYILQGMRKRGHTMDIGEKIAHYRALNGMTQVQVAQNLGITRSAVNSWEMGQSVPQVKHVVALATLFNVTVDCLTTGEDTKTIIDISNLNHEEQALVMQLIRCLGKHSE